MPRGTGYRGDLAAISSELTARSAEERLSAERDMELSRVVADIAATLRLPEADVVATIRDVDLSTIGPADIRTVLVRETSGDIAIAAAAVMPALFLDPAAIETSAAASALAELGGVTDGDLKRQLTKPNALLNYGLLQNLGFAKAQQDKLADAAAMFFGTGQDRRLLEALKAKGAITPLKLATLPYGTLILDVPAAFHDLLKLVRARAEWVAPTTALLAALDKPTVAEIRGMNKRERQALARQYPGLATESAANFAGRITALNTLIKKNDKVDYLHSDLDKITEEQPALWAPLTNPLPPPLTGQKPRDWLRDFFIRYQILHRIAGSVSGAVELAMKGIRSAREAAERRDLPAAVKQNACRIVGEISSAVLSIAQLEELPTPVNNQQTKSLWDGLGETAGFTELFGDRASCKCEHCRSILGPAAYFIDLLDYVNTVEAKAQLSIRDNRYRLQTRRPDLWTLELTCDATKDEVPYLDLVNVVLRDTLTARGVSQPRNTAAIKTDGFAWPQNPALREVESLLGEAKLKRAGAIRLLVDEADASYDRRLAEARMGVSQVEAELIESASSLNQSALRTLFERQDVVIEKIGNSPNLDLDELLGLPNLPAGSLMPIDVRALTRVLVLEREVLVPLLESRYTKGNTPVSIVPRRSSVEAFQNDIEMLRAATFPYLQRLTRMLRCRPLVTGEVKEEWEVGELSYVLEQIQSFVDFARVVHLQRELGLNVAEVCAFFGEIPSTSLKKNKRRSLREQVFGTRRPLYEDGSRDTYAAVRTRLMGLVDLAPGPLDELFEWLRGAATIASETTPLGLAELTAFYRYARLASALDLEVPELLNICRFAEVVRLTSLQDVERVLEAKRWLVQRGASAANILAAVSALSPEYAPAEFSELLATFTPDQSANTREAFREHLAASWGTSADNILALESLLGDALEGGAWSGDDDYQSALSDDDKAPLQRRLDQLKLLLAALPAPFLNAPASEKTPLSLLADSGYALAELELFDVVSLVNFAHFAPTLVSRADKLGVARNDWAMAFREAVPGVNSTFEVLLSVNEEQIDAVTDDWPAVTDDVLVTLSELAERIALSAAFGLRGDELVRLKRSDDVGGLELLAAPLADSLRRFGNDSEGVSRKLEAVAEARRGAERDMLLGLLKTNQRDDESAAPKPEIYTDEGWYEYLLIDVARSGCAMTTKVATGISSVQLYLDRINQRQEAREDEGWQGNAADKGVPPSVIEDFEWNYRQSYRVWEGGRKIYLHPENFLHPDLRDDKTEIFRELEDTLLQQKVTSQSALLAYQEYIRKFMRIAKLQPSGAFSTGPGEGGKTLITSVSADDPVEHYLQEYCHAKNSWSECRRIEVAIPTRSVSPVVTNGVTRLYWTTHNTRATQAFSDGYSQLLAYRHRVELKYAEQFPDGKWQQPQQVDIDFSGVGYGLKNTIVDVFARESALAKKLGDTTKTIQIETKLLQKLATPLSISAAITVLAKPWPNNGSVPTISSSRSNNKDVVFKYGKKVDVSEKLDFVAWNGLWRAISEWLKTTTQLTVKLDGDRKLLVTIPAIAVGPVHQYMGTFPLPGTSVFAEQSVKVTLSSDPVSIPFAALPTQIQGKIANTLKIDVDGTPLPIFDIEPHHVSRELYGLNEYVWGRPFPEVSDEAVSLIIPGRVSMGPVNTGFESFTVNYTTRQAKLAEGAEVPESPSAHPWLRYDASVKTYSLASYESQSVPWLDGKDTYAARSWFADSRATDFGDDWVRAHSPAANLGARPAPDLGGGGEILKMREEPDALGMGVINRDVGSGYITVDGESFLITGGIEEERRTRAGHDPNLTTDYYYSVARLGSSLGEQIAEAFSGSVEDGLSLEQQMKLKEERAPFALGGASGEDLTLDGELPFDGPVGVYLREIFFHIPYTIAVNLNAQGEYEEAQRWFEFLFDPTAPESAHDDQPEDRVWRSRYLRSAKGSTLRDLFSQDGDAAALLEEDPFNPYAIARMRRSAFQKAVVVRYVDNLIDHADTLFRQFRRESIEQALRLYVRAKSLLGERPYEIGDCGESGAATYEALSKSKTSATDIFLHEVERQLATPSQVVIHKSRGYQRRLLATQTMPLSLSGRFARIAPAQPQRFRSDVAPALFAPSTLHNTAPRKFVRAEFEARRWNGIEVKSREGGRAFAGRRSGKGSCRVPNGILDQVGLLLNEGPTFCIPRNERISELWHRLEGRLFNLRNCRDIDGTVRQPSPFAPPLDLEALIKAGLSGESSAAFLGAQLASMPAYRFSYLIEKAKSLAASVQSLGNAFQSAKEKYDVESLTALRAQYETSLLTANARARELERDSAEEALQGLFKRKEQIAYRLAYTEEQLATGLIPSEAKQQQSSDDARQLRTIATGIDLAASIAHLIPELGSPFSMKYGGLQLGNASSSWSDVLRLGAGLADGKATAASLDATFERRREGWEHQLELAAFELEELESQIKGAELRKLIAEDAQTVYERQLAQSEVVRAFHSDKFSRAGLHEWLAKELKLLHRAAYNGALRVANMALEAAKYELNVEEPLGNEWNASYNGLLSGERLVRALHALEETFITENTRKQEVVQRFSMATFQSVQLQALRDTGSCRFEIGESMLAATYPKHYRRFIKDVRITIPAVAGPNTSIGAELRLVESSQIREDGAKMARSTPGVSKRISTSSARNDGGRFELSFRDERYAPFEGEGAISTWELTLPAVKMFDYNTISDVIFELAYTAEFGSISRPVSDLRDSEWTFVYSMRREFPSERARLAGGDSITINVSQLNLPFFLTNGRTVQITGASSLTPQVQANFDPGNAELTLPSQVIAGDVLLQVTVQSS